MFVYIRSTAFVIVVIVFQRSKNVTAKCTETLSPPPSIQYLLELKYVETEDGRVHISVLEEGGGQSIIQSEFSLMLGDDSEPIEITIAVISIYLSHQLFSYIFIVFLYFKSSPLNIKTRLVLDIRKQTTL